MWTLLWLAVGCVVGRATAQEGAHGAGHAEHHANYKQWRQPDQPWQSCCNDADCRPTRAFKDDFGNWRAWDGRSWLFVPPAKLLAPDLLGDGRSHLCSTPDGYVYCLSPAEPKI